MYVNTRGRTREQIVQEAELREAVSDFLDRRPDLRDATPARCATRSASSSAESRAWVGARAGGPPGFAARIREWAHLAWVALLVLIALPFALVVRAVYAFSFAGTRSATPRRTTGRTRRRCSSSRRSRTCR